MLISSNLEKNNDNKNLLKLRVYDPMEVLMTRILVTKMSIQGPSKRRVLQY